MYKVLTVIGTRPQIIKSSIVSHELKKIDTLKEILVDTGQHYDYKLSKIFFDEMGIRSPKYNLGVGSGSHSYQTSQMIMKVEKVIEKESPNILMVYGDTNSTLSAALAASKKQIKIIHVESGLRSYNKLMPEEINRVLTDHLSDYLFVTTETAKLNLIKENFNETQISNVGDVMLDSALKFSKNQDEENFFKKFDLMKNGYALVTIHRQENLEKVKLIKIFQQLDILSKKIKLLMPLHPGTKKKINDLDLKKIFKNKRIKFIQPISYLDNLTAIKNSKIVITDSGGMQRESYFLNIPSIIVRNETEWTELIKEKASFLSSPNEISKTYKNITNEKFNKNLKLFGNGKAALKIAKFLKKLSLKK